MPQTTMNLHTICGDSYEASTSSKHPRPRNNILKEVHECMAYVKAMMIDATESLIYMGGMGPLDHDDPYLVIFRSDFALDCDSHIESEFSTSKRILPV